jgi:hypothetical protein
LATKSFHTASIRYVIIMSTRIALWKREPFSAFMKAHLYGWPGSRGKREVASALRYKLPAFLLARQP